MYRESLPADCRNSLRSSYEGLETNRVVVEAAVMFRFVFHLPKDTRVNFSANW